MTHPHDDPHPVDDLVRAYLEQEEARVDAAAMLARVQSARSAATSSNQRSWARGVGVALALGLAASLAFLFLTGQGPDPEPLAAATAEELVRESQQRHAMPTDRCYSVVAEWEPGPMRRLKLEPGLRNSKLWTRGDEFWIETTDVAGRTIAWGQTRDGKVWVAPSRSVGLIYDERDVGEPLTQYCDLMSLRVVATLGDLLANYDLFRRDSGQPGEPIRIEARLRPVVGPLPRFGHVALELDPDTKVIRKAILTRRLQGEVVGTLTFTLHETGPQPDDAYTVFGHLDAQHRLFDGALPTKRPDPRIKLRDEMLKRFRDRAGS